MYVPFHVYSMRQAIDEGYILDVLANYTHLRDQVAAAQRRSRAGRVAIANPEVDEAKARNRLSVTQSSTPIPGAESQADRR